MDTISDFVSQKDEVKRLNKQIDMIAGFYFNFYKNKITKLSNKIKVQRELKDRAIKSRQIARSKQQATVSTLVKLKSDGDITMTDKKIAEVCNVSIYSVTQSRHLTKGE